MTPRRWVRSSHSGLPLGGSDLPMAGFRAGSPSSRISAGVRPGGTRRSVVDRLACVSLPALPLQLLLRRHPEWAVYPVAVVAEDRSQGLICYVNTAARKAGVRSGLRYAAGCSLTADLRAGVIQPAEINEAVKAITEQLRRFTPEIEPSAEEPGIFWLNGTGLHLLYPSYEAWARLIVADLNRVGFCAIVVVGFTRFGTYAVARAQNGIVVFNDPDNERVAARRVRLEYLELDPDLRDTLVKLGVTTVGAFLALPAGGLQIGRAHV